MSNQTPSRPLDDWKILNKPSKSIHISSNSQRFRHGFQYIFHCILPTGTARWLYAKLLNYNVHQENSKLLIFYLICLNPLNLKLSKIREEKRRGLDLFFLRFLNFFLILLKSTCCPLLLIFKKKLSAFKGN